MNTTRKHALTLVTGALLPLIFLAGIDTAQASRPPRSGSSTVVRTGPAGNTSTRQSNLTTNGAGGYSAHSSVTGARGGTATRQQTGSYNPATQTYTRAGTSTGPNGNTSSFSTSTQKTSEGYARQATRTGPNGNAVNSTGSASYDKSTGTLNQSRTSTAANGKSATETRTATVTPTTP